MSLSTRPGPVDPATLDCYADLEGWAVTLCETGYEAAMAHGRRRRAARVDFVAGWKEAARQLGRLDVFKMTAADVPT
jgi:hypothetical protein